VLYVSAGAARSSAKAVKSERWRLESVPPRFSIVTQPRDCRY
jgi:hypothetical protein